MFDDEICMYALFPNLFGQVKRKKFRTDITSPEREFCSGERFHPGGENIFNLKNNLALMELFSFKNNLALIFQRGFATPGWTS